MIDKFMPYLNDGDLVEEVTAANGKDTYVMPARRNAGHLAIVLIREITAPTVFRNAEEEITDIEDQEGGPPGCARLRASSSLESGGRGPCWCYAPGTSAAGCHKTALRSANACRYAMPLTSTRSCSATRQCGERAYSRSRRQCSTPTLSAPCRTVTLSVRASTTGATKQVRCGMQRARRTLRTCSRGTLSCRARY